MGSGMCRSPGSAPCRPYSEAVRDDLGQTYRQLRPYAFAIAYRMLGTVTEAEDVVQDAFVRLGQAGEAEIRSPKAYLATVTTRLALDVLRSARVQRESYAGPWLPEPLPDGTAIDAVADGAAAAELADSLSMAFLVVLESLSPVERAAFLLHDVFGYDYAEIAAILDKSEPNVRQITSRARRRVHDNRPRFEASREQRDRLAEKFFAACQGRDMDGLVRLLADDAALYGDGGTKGAGINRPIFGRDNVAQMLLTWFRLGERADVRIEPAWVNGQPGAMMRDPLGRLVNVIALDISGGEIHTVRSVINPDKLSHLGPLSPLNRRHPEQS